MYRRGCIDLACTNIHMSTLTSNCIPQLVGNRTESVWTAELPPDDPTRNQAACVKLQASGQLCRCLQVGWVWRRRRTGGCCSRRSSRCRASSPNSTFRWLPRPPRYAYREAGVEQTMLLTSLARLCCYQFVRSNTRVGKDPTVELSSCPVHRQAADTGPSWLQPFNT